MQVVVVLSGSMEPAFYRGDILFLYMGRKPFSAGEVVVFNINGRDIPIVHRIIKVHERIPGSKQGDDVRILTKVRLHTPCACRNSCKCLSYSYLTHGKLPCLCDSKTC